MPTKARTTSASAQTEDTLESRAAEAAESVDEFDWDTLTEQTRAQEYTRNNVPAVDKASVRASVPAPIVALVHDSYAAFEAGYAKGEAEFGTGHRRAQILASQTSTRVTKVPNRERGEKFLKHARTYAAVAQINGKDVQMTVRGDVNKEGTEVVWRAKPKETRARVK